MITTHRKKEDDNNNSKNCFYNLAEKEKTELLLQTTISARLQGISYMTEHNSYLPIMPI